MTAREANAEETYEYDLENIDEETSEENSTASGDAPEDEEEHDLTGSAEAIDNEEPEDTANPGVGTNSDDLSQEETLGSNPGVGATVNNDDEMEATDGSTIRNLSAELAEEQTLEDEMDEKYGARSGAYNLRPRKNPSTEHLLPKSDAHKATSTESGHVMANTSAGGSLATPQMNMRKGIQVFGKAGIDAIRKEVQQLHDRKVMEPKKWKDLTREQKRMALEYLMFLKRKRCGRVKGRGCVDGRPQRAYIKREDAMSPTVATEAVFLTALRDAQEGRDVGICDVPGAFMQADMDDIVYVRFTGPIVDQLLEIDRELYESCVIIERGEKVIYVELLKALYGTMKAARLFWEKLSGLLTQKWGFTLNPYDSCVANKTINGKQCTVVWHVDDLKISHVDPDVVSQVISDLNSEFGDRDPLTVTRGKVHEYLGMTLDFSNPGELIVNMEDYIDMILQEDRRGHAGNSHDPCSTEFVSGE